MACVKELLERKTALLALRTAAPVQGRVLTLTPPLAVLRAWTAFNPRALALVVMVACVVVLLGLFLVVVGALIIRWTRLTAGVVVLRGACFGVRIAWKRLSPLRVKAFQRRRRVGVRRVALTLTARVGFSNATLTRATRAGLLVQLITSVAGILTRVFSRALALTRRRPS